MNSRKGLKRYGMSSYIVVGPRKTYLIDREGRKFFVRPATHPRGFFAVEFSLLRDARPYAEMLAGIEPEYPYPEIPVFLRRWHPKRVSA